MIFYTKLVAIVMAIGGFIRSVGRSDGRGSLCPLGSGWVAAIADRSLRTTLTQATQPTTMAQQNKQTRMKIKLKCFGNAGNGKWKWK